MPAYATTQEVLDYLGQVANDDVTDRIILRASELIDHATMGNIDTTNADHAEAAKNAVCAQVEYWLEVGEGTDISQLPGFNLGSFSVKGKVAVLAPRARRYLFSTGLLNTEVKLA